MQANSEYRTASGLAALSIGESLLVSLCDQKIMGEKEVVDFSRMLPRLIAMGSLPRRIRKPHHAAADVIDRIIARKNSVRHAADEG